MSLGITVRIARPEDAQSLLDIYAPYVRDTAITFEYEVPSREEFASRILSTLEKYPFLVAEENGETLGYACVGAFKDRPAYDWAVEATVYVRQDKRRMGIGRILYTALETALKAQGILNLNACIAWPVIEDKYLNRDSAEFHSELGFQPVAHFHTCGFKFGRWYDMVWMEKLLGTHRKDQPPVTPFSALPPMEF